MEFVNNINKLLFSNEILFIVLIFKIIALILIICSLNKDPNESLLLVIVFIIITYILDIDNFEKMDNINSKCDKYINTKTNILLLNADNVINPDNKDWKDICCCDYNNSIPLLTDICLNRIGSNSKKPNFDYKKYVCKNY